MVRLKLLQRFVRDGLAGKNCEYESDVSMTRSVSGCHSTRTLQFTTTFKRRNVSQREFSTFTLVEPRLVSQVAVRKVSCGNETVFPKSMVKIQETVEAHLLHLWSIVSKLHHCYHFR